MNMHQHILAALREEQQAWEMLLAGLSSEFISAPLTPSEWSIKDVIAHLRAWQQRSIARMEAAVHNREPVFPTWSAGLDPELEASTDQVNAWIYAAAHDQSWPVVYQNWKTGFERFLELAQVIPERDLLDGGRYPWLSGHPLAFILVASYDHHQEHLDILQAWLLEHENNN